MKPQRIETLLPGALPAIWRFGLSLTGDVELTGDLVQSTCLRALERADQFRSEGSFVGWCLRICRSIWLNEMRTRARERAFATLDETEIVQISSAENDLYAREMIAQVMKLPEAQRTTAVLVFAEQFTYSEAAHILDVPIGTVMSRLHAARTTLRRFAETRPNRGPLTR